MKEIMIYRKVRRDPFMGNILFHEMNANSKNRYNTLAGITIKSGNIVPVEFVIIQECTDAPMFCEFVKILLEQGTLQKGDVFVVDNCTIHMQGSNIGLQETLFEDFGILMIPLPPYHPDFNPTELIFNTLISRLRSQRARFNSLDAGDFLDAITLEMMNFDKFNVKQMYLHCGYNII